MVVKPPAPGPEPDRGANVAEGGPGLGPSLRRAWVGYQLRLDEALEAAGFGRPGFPDGRVLRICAAHDRVTISDIGRDLAISRQAAAKIVAGLHDRRYVAVRAAPEDRRQKVVELTALGAQFLEVHRRAAKQIEVDLRRELGPESFEGLARLLAVLDAEDAPRLSDYLRAKVMTRVERTAGHGGPA